MTRKPGRREALALAVARGATTAKASKEAGYSTRQAFRLLADAEFRREVSILRGRLVDRACGLLAAGNAAAVQTLRGLLADDSPGVRLAAAKAILELCVKIRDAAEISERVDALETLLKGISHDQQEKT